METSAAGLPAKRAWTRVGVEVRVQIRTEDGPVISGTVLDLSLKGIGVATDARLPSGTACEVKLFLEGGLDTVEVETRGTVTRSDDRGIALEFGTVVDGSLDHLRKLVLYNSADPGVIEGEFGEQSRVIEVEPDA